MKLNEPVKVMSTRTSIAILIFSIIGTVILVGFFSGSSSSSGNSSTQTKSVYAPDEIDLHIQAQQFVLQALKSPSTAKFPPLPYDAVKINTPEGAENNDGVYRVRSYVDSQNSFGAMIRNDWTVEMMLVKEHWILTRMVVAGKVVYDALSGN